MKQEDIYDSQSYENDKEKRKKKFKNNSTKKSMKTRTFEFDDAFLGKKKGFKPKKEKEFRHKQKYFEYDYEEDFYEPDFDEDYE